MDLVEEITISTVLFHPNLKWEHEYFYGIRTGVFVYLSLLRFVKNSDIIGCLKILIAFDFDFFFPN